MSAAHEFAHTSSPDCHDRWLQPRGSKRLHGHITYRDKASQGMCKSARPNLQDTTGEVEEPQGAVPPTTGDAHEASAAGSELPEEEALLDREPDAEPPPDGVEKEDADGPRHPPDGAEHGSWEEVGDEDDHDLLERPLEHCIQEERRPSLAEYKKKWDRLEQCHTRPVKGNFGNHNLVPTPVPQLFQNCPWVPFHVLTAEDASDEAHARLSRCFPLSGLQPSSMTDGIERYAHC